jgi:23S rRNA pseudouridine1911/1915/1917 synthase
METSIPATLDGERIDRVLALLTGLSRSRVATLIAEGRLRIDDVEVRTRSRTVEEGQRVDFDLPVVDLDAPAVAPDRGVEFDVVWSDDDLVVVDKPSGLVVHPGAGHEAGTLVNGLVARFPEITDVGQRDRPGIVHRLDRFTSGLLAVARTHQAYDALVSQLAARSVGRRYDALVWGSIATDQGLIDAPIGRSSRDPTRMAVVDQGREARTRYQVVERFTDPVEVTLADCALETGRTHQIRVHLSAIEHPVVGDTRYGGARQSLALSRPFLHARHLELTHPVTGESLAFEAPLPDELREVLAHLG